MHNLITFLTAAVVGFANCEYTEPVTNFKQLVNGNKYGFFRNSFIPNTNNTIQLSWDHIHFYHGYEFYWWTDVNPSYTKFYVDTVKLEKTRLDNIEYYSFTEYSRDTYVYYIQLQGWLYGRGHGKISKVLKTLKPNYGQPFPVSNIQQLYSTSVKYITLRWDFLLSNETGLFPVQHYMVEYCWKDNCHSDRTNKNSFMFSIDVLNSNDLYSIIVYGATPDGGINQLSRKQAKRVVMRPGYFGQPSNPKEFSQIKSKTRSTIILRWKMLTGDECGASDVLGYRVSIYEKADRFKLVHSTECNSSYSPDNVKNFEDEKGYTYCVLSNIIIPSSHQNSLVVDLNGFNNVGKGFLSSIVVNVGKNNIFTGLPSAVKNLMLWHSYGNNGTIRLRWLKVPIIESGYFPVLSYLVTVSGRVGRNRTFYKEKIVDHGEAMWRYYGGLNNYHAQNKSVFSHVAGLKRTEIYNISVCAMTKLGCGEISHLYNVRTGYHLDFFPPKVISINQSPDYKHDHITLRWVIEARRGDLPLLGFQFKVACSSAQKTLITAVFIVQFKSKTLNNSSVFQHSLQTGCPATTLPEKPVYVEIKSFNSYLFSPTRHLITKYQYVGFSSPEYLHIEKCTDRVVLVWKQISKKHDGYCISHRSKSHLAWNSCCIKKDNPMLKVENGEVLFEQILIESRFAGNNRDYLYCSRLYYGDIQFKVAAFNRWGTGYYTSLEFTKCGLYPDKSNAEKEKSKTSITLIFVLMAVVFFTMLVLVIWRVRVRCTERSSVLSRVERMTLNDAAGTPSQGIGDEDVNEQMQLMKPPYRLPTYREALENDAIDPPPYSIDGGGTEEER